MSLLAHWLGRETKNLYLETDNATNQSWVDSYQISNIYFDFCMQNNDSRLCRYYTLNTAFSSNVKQLGID